MTTWERARLSFTPEKMAWYRRFPYSNYLLKPLSMPLICLAWEAGLTANAVTLLSALCGGAACVLLADGSRAAGAALLIGFNILDGIDGSLARMGRSCGTPGKFLDGTATAVYWFSYLALGLGLARRPDAFSAGHPVWAGSNTLLACGGLASAGRFASAWIAGSFWSNLGDAWQASPAKTQPAPGTPVTESWPYNVYLNIVMLEAHDFVLLACVFAGLASAFLLASTAIVTLHLLVNYAVYVRRALSLSDAPARP